MRRLAGTRKVGHAGTLDPMATGVLLLGRRARHPAARSPRAHRQGLRRHDPPRRHHGHRRRRGRGRRPSSTPRTSPRTRSPAASPRSPATIEQRPSSVSAIKVDGVRSYARVRCGRGRRAAGPPRHGVAVRVSGPCGLRRRRGRPRRLGGVLAPAPTCARSRATSAPALGVGGHLTCPAPHPGRTVRPRRRAHPSRSSRSRSCSCRSPRWWPRRTPASTSTRRPPSRVLHGGRIPVPDGVVRPGRRVRPGRPRALGGRPGRGSPAAERRVQLIGWQGSAVDDLARARRGAGRPAPLGGRHRRLRRRALRPPGGRGQGGGARAARSGRLSSSSPSTRTRTRWCARAPIRACSPPSSTGARCWPSSASTACASCPSPARSPR